MRASDLVTDPDGRLSLGRVAFWLFFAVVLWRYATTGQVGPDGATMVGLLLGYGGVKKFLGRKDAA